MNILPIFFIANHDNYGGFLESSNSYWNDTRSNLIVKMLSIFDIFSRSNFFINSLFYNFLIFFGTVALYRVFIEIFPDLQTCFAYLHFSFTLCYLFQQCNSSRRAYIFIPFNDNLSFVFYDEK